MYLGLDIRVGGSGSGSGSGPGPGPAFTFTFGLVLIPTAVFFLTPPFQTHFGGQIGVDFLRGPNQFLIMNVRLEGPNTKRNPPQPQTNLEKPAPPHPPPPLHGKVTRHLPGVPGSIEDWSNPPKGARD